MKILFNILERIALLVLLCLWLAPVTLSLIKHLEPSFLNGFSWVWNSTLVGQIPNKEKLDPSRETLTTAAYQQYLESSFNVTFPCRELLIRLTCEGWLRTFQQSPLNNSSIVIGKNKSLFEIPYLGEYCLRRPSRDEIEPFVINLEKIQKICAERHIGFVVVITPSKAAIHPDLIPQRWLSRYDAKPRAYEYMVSLLQKHGVHFINGHEIIASKSTDREVPFFPLGGIHLGQVGSLLIANDVIDLLNKNRTDKFQRLVTKDISISHQPKGQDSDLFDILNVIYPWHYPVEILQLETPVDLEKPKETMVCIGGSFNFNICNLLSLSGNFSEISNFFYYDLHKCTYNKGGDRITRKPVKAIDFGGEVFAADNIILEMNEAVFYSGGASHLEKFIENAFAYLAKEDVSKKPQFFSELSRQSIERGGNLLFLKSENASPLNLINFSEAEENGTWTLGKEASLFLKTSQNSEPLTMEIELAGFAGFPGCPHQSVKVYANGGLVAEWEFTAMVPEQRSFVIPAETILSDGILDLTFKISNPTSPTSINLAADGRELGVKLKAIHLK